MRKLIILLLSVVVLGLAGCSSKPENTDTKNTPTPTPIATSTPEVTKKPETTPTPEATDKTENQTGIVLTDTYVVGTFIEKAETYPTTISFKEDRTFASNVNVCSGMLDVTGTYTLEGDTISLFIPDETGIYYLDHDQPFKFIVTKDSLKHKTDEAFSCADVGDYLPKE